MKKILGIVLAFVMLVTVLAILPLAAENRGENGYYVHLDQGITLVHRHGETEEPISVAAKEIGDVKEFSCGCTNSVKSYLDELAINDKSSYTATLVEALLKYGAAAQDYFGYKTDALVGAPVEDTAALEATAPIEPVVNDDAGIYMGTSLLLEGTLQLRFYFMGTDVTTNYGKATNPTGKAYSYVDVPVMPYDMADAVTVTVGETSVTYAPINYLKNKVEDEALSTMVASIYAYGAAAKAYALHDHEFDGGAITLPATCTTDGVKTKTCACGETTTEVIAALGHRYNSGTVTKAATCAPGEKKFTCTRSGCGHVKTTEIAPVKEHTVDETELIISTAPTATTVGERSAICEECEGWATYTYTYAEYNALLATERDELDKITVSGDTSIGSNNYAAPLTYPTKGEHPRLLINSEVLATIRSALENEDTREEMISILRDVCFKANDYDSGAVLGTATNPKYDLDWPSGTHNYSEDLLNSITSKAFLYLFTGTEYYAVEALRYIMQYMDTVDMKSDVGDPERYYGHVMFTAALVYDWCYDAMTYTERENLVKGIKNVASGTHDGEGNMKIGFPPSKQGAVCGHGSERQLLRDYLAVALAIYDEYPDWYEYIGGRFYEQYVPVRNEFYKSGMYPQGISVYIGIRFTSDLWSAWLIQSATGTNPYVGQEEVIHSIFSRVVNGEYYFFDEGDDERNIDAWGQAELKRYVLAAGISSYLYNDETAAAWAGGLWIPDGTNKNGEAHRDVWRSSEVVPLFNLILRSTGVDNTGSRHDGLDLICYNGGFMNEIVAHSGWSSKDVSVLMKIGGRTAANHDHADAGSFQIYYKGMLAGDAGFYDTYNHNSNSNFKQYHQATIAHNSILIYNGTTSYGQRVGSTYSTNGDTMTYNDWLKSTYKTADLLGVSYRYDRSGDPKYAYIAGDITPAYQSVSTTYAKKVERRMLSVFNTLNPDAPLYFFVYDRVKTGSSSYQVAFLLQTAEEPTIEGNTVTVNAGGAYSGGKLVLQSVIGAATYTAVENERIYDEDGKYTGYNKYSVNGNTYTADDDGYWGRVEIRTKKYTGTDHTMLNVMYVTDKGKTLSLPATGFSVGTVADGAAIGNTVAVFLKDTTSYNSTLTFTAPDTGAGTKVNYYVSGMADGEWTVECNGQVIYTNVKDGEGILVFNTYAGKEVKITKGHGYTGGSSGDNELPLDGMN